MEIEDPVVAAAQIAFSVRLKDSSHCLRKHEERAGHRQDMARRRAQSLTPDRFQIEAMVTPELDQKIDIVDTETARAYEFKVSSKNAWAEFSKDVVKVLIWNEHRNKKLSCLVFITEEKYGKPFLDAPMPRAYIKYLTEQGLKVSIHYLRHG
jgi:hypothetical protein